MRKFRICVGGYQTPQRVLYKTGDIDKAFAEAIKINDDISLRTTAGTCAQKDVFCFVEEVSLYGEMERHYWFYNAVAPSPELGLNKRSLAVAKDRHLQEKKKENEKLHNRLSDFLTARVTDVDEEWF